MPLKQMDLRTEMRRVRATFDEELAEALRNRTDLTHAEIERQFGVSNKVIRRISKQFNISRKTSRAMPSHAS